MLLRNLIQALLPAVGLAAKLTPRCDASALPTPSVFGASILTMNVIESTLDSSSVSFCNITFTYTHPGQNDSILVWLALPEAWNGRFQGVGGGGWVTGYPTEMVPAILRGYAAVSTDGGHDGFSQPADQWAQVSPGNVDLYVLQNFASVALNDMTVFGKQLTESYYGKPITKSYWSGCSTGGRQGLMMAQRYPDAYDGILATAPGNYWAELLPSFFWPQWIMKQIGYFPPQCELDTITAAAINACDELDGIKDNIISLTGACNFDPSTVVGQPYACGEVKGIISDKAALIANSTWTGSVSLEGKLQWPGIAPGAPLSGRANTTCDAYGHNCTGVPFSVSTEWLRLFVEKDPASDPYSYSHAEWDRAVHASVQQYDSMIGTSDPDLTDFKSAGGKMITWHGMADQLIPFNQTVNYYNQVLGLDAEASDFYRFFAAPGVNHCSGGIGAQPTDPLAALVAWVEDGEIPQTLAANRTVNGSNWEHDLCLYPLASIYKGGDPAVASSYQCE